MPKIQVQSTALPVSKFEITVNIPGAKSLLLSAQMPSVADSTGVEKMLKQKHLLVEQAQRSQVLKVAKVTPSQFLDLRLSGFQCLMEVKSTLVRVIPMKLLSKVDLKKFRKLKDQDDDQELESMVIDRLIQSLEI